MSYAHNKFPFFKFWLAKPHFFFFFSNKLTGPSTNYCKAKILRKLYQGIVALLNNFCSFFFISFTNSYLIPSLSTVPNGNKEEYLNEIKKKYISKNSLSCVFKKGNKQLKQKNDFLTNILDQMSAKFIMNALIGAQMLLHFQITSISKQPTHLTHIRTICVNVYLHSKS